MNPYLHLPTWRLNGALFLGVLGLSAALWRGMPQPYPVHFGWSGEPDAWATGPGMWILLVAICTISFLHLHLLQRFLVVDVDSPLLNVPWRDRFRRLPAERRAVVLRRMNRLLGMVNTVVLVLFAVIQVLIWQTARNPHSAAVVVGRLSLWIVLALAVVVPLAETVAVRRMIRRKLQEEGLWGG